MLLARSLMETGQLGWTGAAASPMLLMFQNSDVECRGSAMLSKNSLSKMDVEQVGS